MHLKLICYPLHHNSPLYSSNMQLSLYMAFPYINYLYTGLSINNILFIISMNFDSSKFLAPDHKNGIKAFPHLKVVVTLLEKFRKQNVCCRDVNTSQTPSIIPFWRYDSTTNWQVKFLMSSYIHKITISSCPKPLVYSCLTKSPLCRCHRQCNGPQKGLLFTHP